MIVEKISMVDALNMETKDLINSYQQMLENMSKEELISEIGRLLVDKGLLLNSRDGYINELKEDNNRLNGLLADGTEVMDYWQDKYLEEKSKNDELQKQVNCLKQEIEEKNTYEEKLNCMIDNLRDDISEQKVETERLKKELANERNAVITFQESANAHRLKVGEVIKQNAELQKQVNECNRDCENYAIENGELEKQVEELKIALKNVIESNEELIEECEQSVKDKSKEIYLWLEEKDKRGMTVPFNMVLRQLKEQFSVGVE